MKSRAVISPKADRDLDAQFLYFAEESVDLARRYFTAAQNTLERLAQMPELGAVYGFERTELADVRVWPVREFGNHLVFYRPVPGGIEVVRVLHGARDIPAVFAGE